jgi:SAM-dependent methyltransferase
MTVTHADTEVRTHLRAMWAAVAPGWAEHADYVDARGRRLTERMLAVTSPLPGQRVLELACGAGDVGLAAAELVAPGGEVVLSDAVPEMTAIAARRAAARGVDSVRTSVYDVERIAEPDASFDVVVCREGLMFAPDPGRAAAEIGRVLRPGGRFAVAVWGPRARNPWLGIVLDATSAQLGAPFPPPGIPGPFALEDADRLAALLTDAGLADVAVEEIEVPLHAASAQEWWTRTCALAGPLAKVLAALPPAAADGIRADALAAAAAFEDDGGLTVPGVTLLASGRR